MPARAFAHTADRAAERLNAPAAPLPSPAAPEWPAWAPALAAGSDRPPGSPADPPALFLPEHDRLRRAASAAARRGRAHPAV